MVKPHAAVKYVFNNSTSHSPAHHRKFNTRFIDAKWPIPSLVLLSGHSSVRASTLYGQLEKSNLQLKKSHATIEVHYNEQHTLTYTDLPADLPHYDKPDKAVSTDTSTTLHIQYEGV